MKDLTLGELRRLNESYITVMEAMARPTAYKNLTPEQAEALAQLSPSYKSQQIWGNTSNWICSAANRMIKFRGLSFDQVYEIAKKTVPSIVEFENYAANIRTPIDTAKTFDDLVQMIATARARGTLNNGLSKIAKNDGRARQCYSLMKNGGDDDFRITYEDDHWLIGYVKNLEYNKKFSAIGKWCHTGSFGDAERYWGEYAQDPIFYILNKDDGHVLCASYLNGGEVRDQQDNYPQGFNGGNWGAYFTDIGLKEPMIDEICDTRGEYVVPDDADTDVWNRVDQDLVQSTLFSNIYTELEGDDYGNGRGNFFVKTTMDAIDPNAPHNDGEHYDTRYSGNVDENVQYTFDEFKALCKETYGTSYGYYGEGTKISEYIFRIISSMPLFQRLWNVETDVLHYGFSTNHVIHDDRPLKDRITIGQFIDLMVGRNVQLGIYDISRKKDDLKRAAANLQQSFIRKFNENKRRAVPSDYGSIDMYGDKILASMDADEANSIAVQIARNGQGEEIEGEPDIFSINHMKFEGEPDIFAINLKGKSSFAVNRVLEDDLIIPIHNAIVTIKYILKGTKDIEGQQKLGLQRNGGGTYYYSGMEDYA